MAAYSRPRLWAVLLVFCWPALAGGDVGPGPDQPGSIPGLHIPAGRSFNSPAYLRDSAGHTWDIHHDLHVGNGTNNVYGAGMFCQVFGSNVSGRYWINEAGDEVETGPCNRGNVTVYRRCKVYRKEALARWVDILVNNTSAPQVVPVRIYSYFNSSIGTQLTSSGGAAFGEKDWALITEHQPGTPRLLHVVCGATSELRPSIQVTGNVLYVNYSVTVPPQGTSLLCYFESQGNTLEELKQRMEKLRAHKLLADLPRKVRQLIANFRIREGLEQVELERRGTGDAVMLKNGDWIVGQISNPAFAMETLHGAVELPAGQVIGFVGAAGSEQAVRAVLAGGQVLTGKLQKGVLELALPTGGGLQIPFERIQQCSYCISKAKPEEMPMTDPLIILSNGDRLAFEAGQLKCTLHTRHGPVPLSGQWLLEIRLHQEAHGLHRAVFLNGSKLAGLLGPERISVPLKLGRSLDIPRDMVLAVRFAEEAKEDPKLGRLELSNEDELFGRLTDTSYDLQTDFGEVRVKPDNILSMAFSPQEPARVRVTLWNDTTLRGQLRQKTLRFAIEPGPVLSLHVGQIVSLQCSDALPPEQIVQLVEKYVAMLSAASYKDRQEAQEKLILMKKAIIPLLRKHLKDTDPEVRQRIQVILERLGDTGAAPAGANVWNAAPGAVWWGRK